MSSSTRTTRREFKESMESKSFSLHGTFHTKPTQREKELVKNRIKYSLEKRFKETEDIFSN